MKINFEEIRKQNWDEGENGLYEIIKNYEHNDLAALAVNYFNDLCTKRIESEILKAENELLRKHIENYVQSPCTDKNGKKIFEGDMVKDNYGNKGFVFYSEHFLRWQIRFTSGRDDLVKYGDIGVHIFDWIYPKIELEIIGNIHDKEENE